LGLSAHRYDESAARLPVGSLLSTNKGELS
jgi:hypothetical protein